MATSRSRHSEFLQYEDLVEEVRSGTIASLYLLTGTEDFLVDECSKLLIEKLVPEESRGFNLDVMYGGKCEVTDVVAHASSYPMMGNRRVVVVKEFERLVGAEKGIEVMETYFQHPLASTCLILICREPDFRKKPFTNLKSLATLVQCKPLYDNQALSWISQRIRLRKKEASPEACQILQGYVGNSLQSLDNEINKLLIYVGDRKEITDADVAAVAGASKGYTVFDLQNAIGRKDAGSAMTILAKMMESGEYPVKVIAVLTRFFSILLRMAELKQTGVRGPDLMTGLGINPYFHKNYLEFSAHFPEAHIEHCFRALLAADTELKSASTDPRLVMDLLVYSLIKGDVHDKAVTV